MKRNILINLANFLKSSVGHLKMCSWPTLGTTGLEPTTVYKAFKTKHIKQLYRNSRPKERENHFARH